MDISGLGNANFSNRQSVESTSSRGDNNAGSSGSPSPLQDGTDNSTSTLVPPPDATQGSAKEDATVQANDPKTGQSNESGAEQTGEQNTGGQVDLTI